MKTGIKIISSTFIIILVLLLGFFLLDDESKADLSIQTFGIFVNPTPSQAKIYDIISENEFAKVVKIEDLDDSTMLLLGNYLMSGEKNNDLSPKEALEKNYALENDEWNAGCIYMDNKANKKFEYLLKSDKAIIICSTVGGLATSPFFEFFELGMENELELIEEAASYNYNLFDLVVSLKFDNSSLE